jgi:hypothetical protein
VDAESDYWSSVPVLHFSDDAIYEALGPVVRSHREISGAGKQIDNREA